MTRINCGIPPRELHSKHLIAEHREIIRIPNTIKSGKAKVVNIPTTFSLGTGHVKFFYDKLQYLHIRYREIYSECVARGFNVTNYNHVFFDLPPHLYNNYLPTAHDRQLLRDRIALRISTMKVKQLEINSKH